MRGQGYNNDFDMKRSHKGSQARVLQEYHGAFYTPCVCHALNLTLFNIYMSRT